MGNYAGGAVTATSGDFGVTTGDLSFNVDSGDTFRWNYTTYNQNVIQFNGLKKKLKNRDFTPFGLASWRDLTLDTQIQKERNKFRPIIYITGRQSGKASYARRFNASVLPQIPTCRMTLVDEAPYKKRPIINIKLKGKVGVINLKNGSKIYTVTDDGEYRHVTGKSLLNLDYSPWTSNNDMNGNDITDVGSITFNNTRPCINFRSKNNSEGTIRFANDGNILWRNQGTEDAPMDIISGANRAYALESIADESKNILDECTGDEDAVASGVFDDYYYNFEDDDNLRISFGGSSAGSIPTSNLLIDTDSIGVWAGKKRRHTITIKLKDVLRYEGLLKAQQILHDAN